MSRSADQIIQEIKIRKIGSLKAMDYYEKVTYSKNSRFFPQQPKNENKKNKHWEF